MIILDSADSVGSASAWALTILAVKAKPDLTHDFGEVNLDFATNLASAAHKLDLI